MKTYFKAILLILLSATLAYGAGSWATNNWTYKPQLTTQGTTDYTQFNLSQDKVDAKLARMSVTYGDPGYTTLAASLTTIGSSNALLVIPSSAGAVAIPTGTTTIPANVAVRLDKGSYFDLANGAQLVVNGPIEAGPWQIFNWTGSGAINLAGSPTSDFYLQNWGATSGLGSDIAAALTKAHNSGISHKTVWVTPGTWRIATPVVFDQSFGFTLKGANRNNTLIVIDVGASADGLTIGTSGIIGEGGSATTVYDYNIEDILFGGAASCCRNGIVVSLNVWGRFFFDATLGATSYAVVFAGPDHTEAKIGIGLNSAVVDAAVTAHGEAANGIRMCSDGSNTYHTGQMNLYVKKTTSWTASGGTGLRLEGVLDDINIMGDFEANKSPYAGYAIWASDCIQVNIHDIHGETIENMLFDRCSSIKMTRVSFPGSTAEGLTQTVTLKSCQGMSIDTCNFGRLVISEDTIGTVIGPLVLAEQHDGLKDYSGSSVYIGPVSYYSPTTLAKGLFGENRDNQITNHLLNRYVSTTNPDRWSLYQCTGAQETGTVHNTTNACKMVTSGGAGEMAYALSADQLNAFRGQDLNFAVWLNLPSAQTFTGTAAYIQAYVTVPNWSAGTAYRIGDAVMSTTPNVGMYVCRVAGTSHAVTEPTWVNTIGVEQTDGTVTWVYVPYVSTTTSAQPITTTEADGIWRKFSVQKLIPRNATAAGVAIDLSRHSDAGEATMYWAEPSLHIGATPGRGVQPGRMEFAKIMYINGTAMVSDSYPPDNGSSEYNTGYYFKPGDVCLNKLAASGTTPGGWSCTTAGTPGTWKAWANLP